MDATTSQLLRLLDEHGLKLNLLFVKITLSRDVADDLMQDLFLRLRDTKGFRNSPFPERYMFRSAINLAFDWRKKNKSSCTTCEILGEAHAKSDCPLETIIWCEEVNDVLKAMEKLTARDQEIITLRFIHEDSYDDISHRLGTTPHRVRGLCSKAIGRLRKILSSNTNKS